MPKTKNRIDASPELDAILGEPITDADRLAEYLKRKAAEQPKQDKEFLFGDFSFDLDFDLPLIKKTQQLKQTQNLGTQKLNNSQPENAASGSDAPAAVASDHLPAPESPKRVSISPSRRSGSKVPDSDRLRRVAIRRRSQSCGRRQLLKEFDNVMNETGKSSTFFPPLSSTPCEHKKQSQTVQQEPDAEPQPENVNAPETQAQLHPVVQSNCAAHDILENLAQYREQVEATFRKTFNIDCTQECSRPTTPQSTVKRQTFTIEKKGNQSPARLVVSNPPTPKSAKQKSIRAPLVRLRRIHRAIDVPDTPPIPAPRRREPETLSQPELEIVVPETQPQELTMNASQSQKLGEIIHNLSRNSSIPMVFIPINSQSPREVKVEQNSSPGTEPAVVVSRSMQTSSPKLVQNVVEIMTDDESDNESVDSTAPLNLAPPGGNTTRLQRLQKKNCRKAAENQENLQLLNLHRTNPDKNSRKTTLSSILNKAPSTPINGEKFAQELVRMSNYEILDLRKRNSMGLIYPLNGHRTCSAQQREEIEDSIKLELMRRNQAAYEVESLPINQGNDEEENCSNSTTAPAPVYYMDTSRRPSRSRSRRHQPPITKELANYMALEKTMQQRRKSRKTTKRSLYTKGDSETEDTNSSSPEKQQRMSLSCTEAVSAAYSCGDFAIVPPPPASLRFSQSLRVTRRSSVQPTRKKLNLEDTAISPPEEFENQHRKQSPSRTLVAPDQEALSEEETVEINQSARFPERNTMNSTKPSHSKSQSIRDEFDDIIVALPPPADFDDHHEETSSPRQISELHSCNMNKHISLSKPKQKKSLKEPRLSISSRAKDLEMVEVSNKRQEEAELQITHNHSSFRVRSLEELTEEVPNRSRTGRTNMPSDQHEYNDDSSDNEKELSNRMASKEKNEKLSRSKSSNKKNPSISSSTNDQLVSNDESSDNGQDLSTRDAGREKTKKFSRSKSNNKKNPPESSTFDELVQVVSNEQEAHTPVPPIAAPTAASDQSIDYAALDDQPSTSQAARKALERSIRKAKSTSKDDAVIFKKPLAPAPRAKKKTTKLDRQLAKLKITTPINGTMMEVDAQDETDQQDTTIRRSKRGQVPLRNNWCHTIKDLTQLDFVRNSIQMYNKKPIAKAMKSTKTQVRTKLPVSNAVLARPPLCSSTPRTVETPEMTRRNSHQVLNAPPSPNCSSIGVEPFSDQEDYHPELPSTSFANNQKTRENGTVSGKPSDMSNTKNRGRPRRKVEAATQSEPEPEPEVACATSDTCDNNQASSQFTSWLNGSESMDITNQLDAVENHTSTVKDLVFKNLEDIDYAFYNTVEKTSLGYMRFKPHQKRDKKRSKTNTMKFIVHHGQFSLEITLPDANESETIVLRHGDMIEIENGTYYSITNMLDKVSVLMFIRV